MAFWHGTTGAGGEFEQLLVACSHNCRGLEYPDAGCGELCGPHRMVNDQRTLDGLLWARRCVELLRAEELGYGSVFRSQFRALRPEEAHAWAQSPTS